MSDLRELYQEVILDHSRQPRNCRRPAEATCEARGDNPLCGDKVTVYVTLENGVVKDAAFQGRGCAISTASASLMTELVKGKTEGEAKRMFRRFHEMVTGKGDGVEAAEEDGFERLAVLSGVSEYPMRVKCATLCWHTLAAALRHQAAPVTTELPATE